jgi:hypothetical protein
MRSAVSLSLQPNLMAEGSQKGNSDLDSSACRRYKEYDEIDAQTI